MYTLHIIGAGHVGQVLGKHWATQGLVQLETVLNRSYASAQAAVDFIQGGQASSDPQRLTSADLVLVGCPDDQLAPCADLLAECGVDWAGTVVFHCSGALAADVLQPVQAQGAAIASVHPAKSFATQQAAYDSFAGTFCGMEGDAAALTVLEPLFKAIGGKPFRLNAAHKTLYHAASVMACNYVVALQALSLKLLEQAGLEPSQAQALLQPLVTETVHHVFQDGPMQALTGPIARGDSSVVAQQLQALQHWHAPTAQLYQLLGQEALQLAQARGDLEATQVEKLQALLNPPLAARDTDPQ